MLLEVRGGDELGIRSGALEPVGPTTARVLLGEIGRDTTRFPSAGHKRHVANRLARRLTRLRHAVELRPAAEGNRWFRTRSILQAFGPQAATVTFLPSFWLVVRGSLGLRSLTQMFSDHAAGLAGQVPLLFAMTSIALGTLVGASPCKALTEHFGWWRLRVGRAGSCVQRARRRKPQGGSKS